MFLVTTPPECFSPKTGLTESPCTAPDYVRVKVQQSESVIELNAFVQADAGSVWEETTYTCSCGCELIDSQETTDPTTDAGNKEFLVGTYSFDMDCDSCTCTSDADITLTFTANGRAISETISVIYDDSEYNVDNYYVKEYVQFL